ncbi:MAG: hypothetical protein OSB07_09080 [Dehalococcoidia bacterium]|nr:hypothetical protein [Dehalococcoidia bacterium]
MKIALTNSPAMSDTWRIGGRAGRVATGVVADVGVAIAALESAVKLGSVLGEVVVVVGRLGAA